MHSLCWNSSKRTLRPNQSCEMLSLFWQDSLLSHTSKVVLIGMPKKLLVSRLNNCVSLSLLMVEISYGERSVCSGRYSNFTYIHLFIVKSIEKYFNHSITNGKTRTRTIRLLHPSNSSNCQIISCLMTRHTR